MAEVCRDIRIVNWHWPIARSYSVNIAPRQTEHGLRAVLLIDINVAATVRSDIMRGMGGCMKTIGAEIVSGWARSAEEVSG
jgi:hypothetical protein